MRRGNRHEEPYDYAKQRRRPEWKKKSAEMRGKFPRCQKCGRKSRFLAVHHRWYEYGRLPWEYPDSAYMVVCNGRCHREADEDREDQEFNAKNERQYGWRGELANVYRPPRGTSERLFREHETEFHAWLIRRGVLPEGPWTSELYPLWYFWNTDSANFFAELSHKNAVQGQLDLF